MWTLEMALTSLIFVFVGIISSFFAAKALKHDLKHMDDKHFVVQPQKYLLVVSYILLLFLITTITLVVLLGRSSLMPILYGICIPGLLIDLLAFLMSMRYKIIIEDEEITYVPIIGRKKEFRFSEITKIVKKDTFSWGAKTGVNFIVYVNEKKLALFNSVYLYANVFLKLAAEHNIPIIYQKSKIT